MGSLRGLSQMESDAMAVVQLLDEATENLDELQLQKVFEDGEARCREALNDHYVSLRLIK